MKTLALFALVLFAAHAFADADPSVWEQMQTGSVTTIEGIVKGLDIRGTSVLVKIADGDDGQVSTHTLKLCTADSDNFRSEEERAVFFHQRVQSLREAYKSGESVQLSYRGPWQPCLVSVAIGKG